MYNQINNYRSQFCLKGLNRNVTLETYAQSYSNFLASQNSRLIHSNNATTGILTPYTLGENLYFQENVSTSSSPFNDPTTCTGRLIALMVFSLFFYCLYF